MNEKRKLTPALLLNVFVMAVETLDVISSIQRCLLS